MAVDTTATKATTKTQHPVYTAMEPQWKKWRLAYQGGEPFKLEYVYPYSKRENMADFKTRRKLTYVPGHAKAVINIIRNAIAIRLPDVRRVGSEAYLEAMDTNVDGFNNSINTFIALDVAPMLLVHGKRYVVVDAPAAEEGVTLAEDEGLPYFFSLSAEDVPSWSYDTAGNIRSILMRLVEDIEDPQTRLIKGSKETYRLMVRLEAGESYSDSECGELEGPGVMVKTFDKDGKNTVPCEVMDWDRVPVAEFRLVDSIMKEIVDHQIALLNLCSTDMDFLWRGNFPLYTEQQAKGAGVIRPRGSKARASDPLEGDGSITVDGSPDQNKDQTHRKHGVSKGVGYQEGLERPDFISPATDNLKASMEKQQAIITEVRVLVDLALVSLSVKALEQSGRSKEADRVGEEAGLSYIGRALEGGERDLNELWHMMAGIDAAELEVQYPAGYSVKTQDERLAEAEAMRKLRSAVRSEQYQKSMDKRMAEIVLKPVSTAEEMAAILKEIDDAVYFDDDKERAAVVQKDVALKILSKATGAIMRGYDDVEIVKVQAETTADANALASAAGALGGGFPGQGDEDDEEEDDEEEDDETEETNEE